MYNPLHGPFIVTPLQLAQDYCAEHIAFILNNKLKYKVIDYCWTSVQSVEVFSSETSIIISLVSADHHFALPRELISDIKFWLIQELKLKNIQKLYIHHKTRRGTTKKIYVLTVSKLEKLWLSIRANLSRIFKDRKTHSENTSLIDNQEPNFEDTCLGNDFFNESDYNNQEIENLEILDTEYVEIIANSPKPKLEINLRHSGAQPKQARVQTQWLTILSRKPKTPEEVQTWLQTWEQVNGTTLSIEQFQTLAKLLWGN